MMASFAEEIVRVSTVTLLEMLEEAMSKFANDDAGRIIGVATERCAQIVLEELEKRPFATGIFDGTLLHLIKTVAASGDHPPPTTSPAAVLMGPEVNGQ